MTGNYFCMKHNQHFKLLFQTKFTLWHIKLNIYKYEVKSTSHKHLFGCLFSRNAKKMHTDQYVYYNFSSSVHVIDTTCFDECFLFHLITGNHCFYVKVCHYLEILSAPILWFSFKQVFWKKLLFLLSPQYQCSVNTSF